jgi:hypothetical protein
MNRWIKLISIALFAVITIGLLAPLGTTTAHAQQPQPTQDAQQQGKRPAAIRIFIQAVMGAVEKNTKLKRDDVLKGLRDGKTLTELVTANGGNVDTVKADAKTTLKEKLDQAVKDEKITQKQADRLLGYIDTSLDKVFSYQFPSVQTRIKDMLKLQGYMLLVRETTNATDLFPFEIAMQLRDGKTLAQVATANGGDVNKIVDAAVTKATERVNKAVENNRLTREAADKLIASLKDELTKLMNGPAPELPMGGPGGRPGGRGGNRPGNDKGNGMNDGGDQMGMGLGDDPFAPDASTQGS